MILSDFETIPSDFERFSHQIQMKFKGSVVLRVLLLLLTTAVRTRPGHRSREEDGHEGGALAGGGQVGQNKKKGTR